MNLEVLAILQIRGDKGNLVADCELTMFVNDPQQYERQIGKPALAHIARDVHFPAFLLILVFQEQSSLVGAVDRTQGVLFKRSGHVGSVADCAS